MISPLPKKISPNPLISSTIEIRFSSTLSSAETLSIIRPKFDKEFPKLIRRNLPSERDNNPELEYIAEYILCNDDYCLFIDKNIIAFENIGEYHLWNNYYQMVEKNLLILLDTIYIKNIIRVGLRYVSAFEVVEKLSNNFKFGFEVPLPHYSLENELFRTQLCKDDIQILLQLVKNAEITRNEHTQKRTLIDIDVFQNTHLPSSIGNDLFLIIQKLHTEEKNLFFSLLREDFLAKLNCEY